MSQIFYIRTNFITRIQVHTAKKFHYLVQKILFRTKIPDETSTVLASDPKHTLSTLREEVSSSKERTSIHLPSDIQYVEYEGNTYHIERFLSLQIGKVSTP